MVDVHEITKSKNFKIIDNFLSDIDLKKLTTICSLNGLEHLKIDKWRFTVEDSEQPIKYGNWEELKERYSESLLNGESPNAKFDIKNLKSLDLIEDVNNLFFNYDSESLKESLDRFCCGHWIWWSIANNVTPLHKDPYSNLFLQIEGEKEWIIYNREYNKTIESDLRYDANNGFKQSNFNIDDSEIPQNKFILKPGQLLFIPPDSWHYVKTLSNSYSINCFMDLEI